LQREQNQQTITKLRVLSHQQQLIRLDFETHYNQDNSILWQHFQQQLPQHDLVILSDYGKGTITDPQPFIQLAKQLGKLILIDPNGSDYQRYQDASYVIPNFKEFTQVVGAHADEQEWIKAGQQLITQLNLKAMLVTRGERGMSLLRESVLPVHMPSANKDVYDVTGASDTVIAVLGLALAAGYDPLTAMRLANTAAGIVVTKTGSYECLLYRINDSSTRTSSQCGNTYRHYDFRKTKRSISTSASAR
jgi:D-beta-D-heptose 7-phosphate kinase/D-beta-D-heptose 1-phosphate adenosyltransferase